MHLVSMHKEVKQFRPAVVIVDPISNLLAAGRSAFSSVMAILYPRWHCEQLFLLLFLQIR
jgi:hypothetical protein